MNYSPSLWRFSGEKRKNKFHIISIYHDESTNVKLIKSKLIKINWLLLRFDLLWGMRWRRGSSLKWIVWDIYFINQLERCFFCKNFWWTRRVFYTSKMKSSHDQFEQKTMCINWWNSSKCTVFLTDSIETIFRIKLFIESPNNKSGRLVKMYNNYYIYHI